MSSLFRGFTIYTTSPHFLLHSTNNITAARCCRLTTNVNLGVAQLFFFFYLYEDRLKLMCVYLNDKPLGKFIVVSFCCDRLNLCTRRKRHSLFLFSWKHVSWQNWKHISSIINFNALHNVLLMISAHIEQQSGSVQLALPLLAGPHRNTAQ